MQLSKIMSERTDDQLKQDVDKYKLLLLSQEAELTFYSSNEFIPEDPKLVNAVEDRLVKIEVILLLIPQTLQANF